MNILLAHTEGDLQIDGTATRNLFGALNNVGTVIHTATGPIRGYQNGVIHNLAEGVYELQQGVLQTWVGAPVFSNEGVVRKTTDATATVGFALDLQDGSDVQVVSGTLNAPPSPRGPSADSPPRRTSSYWRTSFHSLMSLGLMSARTGAMTGGH